MAATKHKHSPRSDYDIYGDIAKIKAALFDATSGVKDRAGEIISQKIDDVMEKSTAFQENVETLVTDKPLKSIGLALGIGVLIGYFLHK